MKIRLSSDLHLEQYHSNDFAKTLLPFHEDDKDSMLVLAGDICSKQDRLVDFLNEMSIRFKNVLFVPGNHEYYGSNYQIWNTTFGEKLLTSDIYFTTGTMECSIIDGVRFIYGTMWADGGKPIDHYNIQFGLNDFRHIRYNDSRFTVLDMVNIFKQSKSQIEYYLQQPFDGKTVIVTHHLPSRRLVSARFWSTDGSDGINGGFVGDCTDLINEYKIDHWLFGHTHCEIDSQINDTHVITNPCGYVREMQNLKIKFIEL